jgi:hypothetical protein
MRWAVAGAFAALVAAASALAEAQPEPQYRGWRFGPIAGSATLTTAAVPLTCSADTPLFGNERRVIRGIYSSKFTGTSMRRNRAAPDIAYLPQFTGPHGNSVKIRVRVRQLSEETVHVRTVTSSGGEDVCTLTEETCARATTRDYRGSGSTLDFPFAYRSRRVWVRALLPVHGAFNSCSGLSEATTLWPSITVIQDFPPALFNRPTATLRFASRARRRSSEPGYRLTGELTYRASVGIRRMEGTPRVR